MDLSFDVGKRLPEGPGKHGRSGVIHTPHGDIQTPAFIPVATKATVKTLTPEQIRLTGAQAILSNAYHLYLQPGQDIVDEAGGVAKFENWHGPTYTDSGGFQVMSLGVGFKKVIAMDLADLTEKDIRAAKRERMAKVDEEGVDFRSIIDGSKHRFTPEKSMQIQHGLGADIMFAFDELTTLVDTRTYQEESVARTHRWAKRCLDEHDRLTRERTHRPKQSLWGVVQGAQYEDLRRQATRGLLDLDYAEDSAAETDANFVITGSGGLVEVQGTAEGKPFSEVQPASRGAGHPPQQFIYQPAVDTTLRGRTEKMSRLRQVIADARGDADQRPDQQRRAPVGAKACYSVQTLIFTRYLVRKSRSEL